MAERRVDRIARILGNLGGRARLQNLLGEIRLQEQSPDLSYQTMYMAILVENQRVVEQGSRARFITSREGESRGWIRLSEASEFDQGSAAFDIEAKIKSKNEHVGTEIREWLDRMDWRIFESTFLTRVLEALGFEDVEITQSTRDGGADARVRYKRGIVEAKAIVSAKRWNSKSVTIEEVRNLRGIKGDEDTAIVITNGSFTRDAQEEARPGQNQRIVYLIDGDSLIEVCKRNGIGVKRVKLPDLLMLDPEVTRDLPSIEDPEEGSIEPNFYEGDVTEGVRRFRDEMLGDPVKGLTVDEIAKLTTLSTTTVRQYLTGPRKKQLGNRIRQDETLRNEALRLVSERRSGNS